MKHILLTTALVAFATVPAFAQTAATTDGTTTAPVTAEMAAPEGAMAEGSVYITQSGAATIYGSEFIGKNVYVTESSGWDASIDAVPDDWENIATVDDVLMTADGDVRGVLVDVGGFLGIGARSVALDMDACLMTFPGFLAIREPLAGTTYMPGSGGGRIEHGLAVTGRAVV